MLTFVFSIILAELKILKAIIISDVIDVMNTFGWFKVTPQVSFYYQDMFKDISLLSSFPSVAVRMLRHVNVNITVRAFIASLEIPWFTSFEESSGLRIGHIFTHASNIAHARQKSRVLCAGRGSLSPSKKG